LNYIPTFSSREENIIHEKTEVRLEFLFVEQKTSKYGNPNHIVVSDFASVNPKIKSKRFDDGKGTWNL